MNITKKRLRQIIEEECAAVMADSQGTPDVANASCNLEMSGQPDHEIKMAYKQLNRAAKYSQSLASRMENMSENNLPAWVQAKITKASDYISMVYHYLEEELDADHDADAIVSLEKQPVNEMMDMLSDPTTLALGAAGIFTLYYMLFGKKPDPEADLQRVRQEIEMKVAKSQIPPGYPGGTEKQTTMATRADKMMAKDRLKQLKKARGIS